MNSEPRKVVHLGKYDFVVDSETVGSFMCVYFGQRIKCKCPRPAVKASKQRVRRVGLWTHVTPIKKRTPKPRRKLRDKTKKGKKGAV